MFRKGLFGDVTSDEGYKFKFRDRAMITYEDDLRKVFLSAEALVPPKPWAIFTDDIRVGSKIGPQLADDRLRKLVLSRLFDVAKFLGYELHVY